MGLRPYFKRMKFLQPALLFLFVLGLPLAGNVWSQGNDPKKLRKYAEDCEWDANKYDQMAKDAAQKGDEKMKKVYQTQAEEMRRNARDARNRANQLEQDSQNRKPALRS